MKGTIFIDKHALLNYLKVLLIYNQLLSFCKKDNKKFCLYLHGICVTISLLIKHLKEGSFDVEL